MATIMIYEPNEIIAQKLCDSLKKEKYNAIRCDENVIPSFSDDSIPLVMMDAQLRWTTCRPLLEAFQKHGCPILFLTGDRKMSAHLRALYGGRSDVLTVPFSQKALHAKVHNALGECAPLRELSVDEKERVALLDGRRVELTAQEFALLLALAVFAGCEKEREPAEITSSQEEAVLRSTAGSAAAFTVTATGPWTLTTTGSGFGISPTAGGRGETTVQIGRAHV